MTEYLRGYYDVYAVTLALMNARIEARQVVHEGLLFEEVSNE